MTEISTDTKDQILQLVNGRKAKISWIATIVAISEDKLISLAPELELAVVGEYLVSQKESNKKKNAILTQEEYDKLYPKPAPSFCAAKANKAKK